MDGTGLASIVSPGLNKPQPRPEEIYIFTSKIKHPTGFKFKPRSLAKQYCFEKAA
jgi:hypothetical protein